MSYEMVVALEVKDPDMYTKYRAAMTPLLHAAGGEFRYDFEVSRVLKPSEKSRLNRVFVISFPDEDSKLRFFEDPDYLAVREQWFSPAVGETHMMGTLMPYGAP